MEEVALTRKEAPSILEEFCFAMVKHDALDVNLDGILLQRIENEGMTIIKRKIMILSPEVIDELYYDINLPVNNHFYPSMKCSLAWNPALCLILGGQNDLIAKVNQLKRIVRKDYGGTVRDDRIHASDTREMSIRSINRVFTYQELSETMCRIPLFAHYLKGGQL